MFEDFLITFRETLEAALVVSIVLGYLAKIEQKQKYKIVYLAIGLGVISSILGAFLFNILAGGFEGRAEELFEGIVMLIGAGLLTSLIFWVNKHKDLSESLKNSVKHSIEKSGVIGLFLIAFTAILREGIETVIFLNASRFASGENNLIGAVLGIITAIILGVLLFKGLSKFRLKKFFQITNVLLILFAAGLFAHGIHELQEAKVVPIVVEHVWDINPKIITEGTYPALHEKGAIGGIFKGLFGYNGNPSLVEVLSYVVYIVFILALGFFQKKRF